MPASTELAMTATCAAFVKDPLQPWSPSRPATGAFAAELYEYRGGKLERAIKENLARKELFTASRLRASPDVG
jgi:hypothetical protein